MKLGQCFVILFLSAVLFAQGEKEDGINIAGVMMQSDVEWFKYIEKGMRDAAEEYGVNFTSGNANMEVTTESSLVDTYSSQGKDAILVSVLDPNASVAALQRAREKGVLVINYNTQVAQGQEYFVGVDNYELGAQMGRYVGEYYKRVKPNQQVRGLMVTINMFAEGRDRQDGFLAALEESNPSVTMVAAQDAPGPEESAPATEGMIQANPGVDFIWAANEGGALGAQVAVRSKGEIGKILVFATDMSITMAKEMLKPNAAIYAVSSQDPYTIGYQSLSTAVKVLNKETVARKTIIPLAFFSKDDPEAIEEYIQRYTPIVE